MPQEKIAPSQESEYKKHMSEMSVKTDRTAYYGEEIEVSEFVSSFRIGQMNVSYIWLEINKTS